MNSTLNREALKEAINNSDWTALLALADLMEEESDPFLEAMRFIIDHNCRPYCNSWQTYLPTEGHRGLTLWGGTSAYYGQSNIPASVFDKLTDYYQYTKLASSQGFDTNCWAKYYDTDYEAYVALAKALTSMNKEEWK